VVGSKGGVGGAVPAGDQTRLQAELAETQEHLAGTSEILSVLARSSSVQDDVFDAIVENARRLCRAQAAQIYVAQGGAYSLGRSVGLTPEFVEFAATHPIVQNRATLVGRISLDRRTQQIADVLADPDYGGQDLQRLGGYRSIMGAPMLLDDEVVGVLMVWRTSVDPFDKRVSSLLTTFAAQAALALRNVELFRALRRRSAQLARKVEQLEALAEVGTAVSSSLDADEVLTTIVTHAVELSGTDGGSLMEYDEDTHLFGVRTAYGTSPSVIEALRATRIHVDETLVGWAALSRKAIQLPNLESIELDPHLQVLYDGGWRSLVAIPLVRQDRVVGALVVRRKTTGAFSDETCEMLSAFASQSAVALTNARLYQQLERQSIELAEVSAHKSEFLASMSHELRTPLNAVIGFSEVLLERMFGELNERQEDYLKDILGSGRHLLALLNDILDLSKVEAGQMQLDVTTFPAQDALQYAMSLVRERAVHHSITTHVDIAPALGSITADELRFKQVLLNLLSNAVKFTPDGGRVNVAAWREATDLIVTVSDTGVGILPEDQERIFDSFQQGGRSASKVEGTGLGLTLTKRIVELHGGRLWLVSDPGAGSTFGFSLPQDPAMTAPVPSPQQWDSLPADDDRPTVVVIEDDASSSELVALHLGAAGLRPVVVRTGEEGLDAVHALRPAAVILDILLPGMDGWEVLSTLKADASTATTPVVVVSVFPGRGRGIALGASDYLVKPVAKDELLASIRRAVATTPGRGQGLGEEAG
jgi:signal transduction histidine kinase/ActR/RegA family two-component response regulator